MSVQNNLLFEFYGSREHSTLSISSREYFLGFIPYWKTVYARTFHHPLRLKHHRVIMNQWYRDEDLQTLMKYGDKLINGEE